MGLINLVVIGEEFNFFYINWNFGCFIVFDFEIVEFCNVLGDFFFFQENYYVICDISNFSINGNIFDFVFINNEYFIKYVLVYINVFDFDYYFLIFLSYMLRK